MKNMKKRLTGLFLVLVMLMTMLLAIPVSAAVTQLSDEEKSSLADSAVTYVASVYVMSDDDLTSLKEYGDFYEIMVDEWMNNRAELGEYVEITSAEVGESDDNIYVTMMTKFTNYDAEVIMYFDSTGAEPMNFVMNTQYSLGEKMAQAGVNTITGVLIVFLILLFLAFLISLFKYVNPSARNKKKHTVAPDPNAGLPKAAPAPAPVVQTVEVDSNDEEIIAVIAAAIAAAEADGTATGDSYVVRSIRRVGTTKSWKRA